MPENKPENGTKSPLEIACDMKHKDLALKVVELEEQLSVVTDENVKLRKKLVRARDVIVSDIGARKKIKIMNQSTATAEDLDEKTIKELDEMLDHFKLVKKPFKPIADEGTTEKKPSMDDIFAPWKKNK